MTDLAMPKQMAGVPCLRPIPYPYRAMLAICSDLDETRDADTYLEIARFLNTEAETVVGPGVGLEVGNSIYFDMPCEQFAYWGATDSARERVRDLIRSGHIDCLHSFGDLAVSRSDALRALDELESHGCRLRVWVDHGRAVTNLGSDIMHGHGDEQGHPAYHADRSVAHGIRYVWRGRVTSVLGQNRPFSLGGLWRARHPLASGRTVAKEAVKHVLAAMGFPKYRIQRANRVLEPVVLRDGQPTLEFLRSNPHWGGVSSRETGEGIGEVLTPAFLDRLVRLEGVCILYTHLGKLGSGERQCFPAASVQALRRLADAFREGRILVTTTRRLLDYCRAARALSCRVVPRDAGETASRVEVDVAAAGGGADDELSSCTDGLTVYVDDPVRTRVLVLGDTVEMRCNPPDHTGRASMSIPWRRLRYPE